MASVDGISPVYVCADRVTFTSIVLKYFCLMSTGVRPQYGAIVNIVRVRTTSSWVIDGEAERVEVLGDCDDRREIIVVGICRGREFRFNDLARYRYRV